MKIIIDEIHYSTFNASKQFWMQPRSRGIVTFYGYRKEFLQHAVAARRQACPLRTLHVLPFCPRLSLSVCLCLCLLHSSWASRVAGAVAFGQQRLQHWLANRLAGPVEGSAASTPAAHASIAFAAGIRSAGRSDQDAGGVGCGAAAARYDVEEECLVYVGCGQRKQDFQCKCGVQNCSVSAELQ
jgi:hypothetical protein